MQPLPDVPTERYFVNKEQVDAANWQMFEAYKETNGRLGTIAGKIQSWGTTMNQLGTQMQSQPYMLPSYGGQIDNLPDKSDLKKAAQELNTLRNEVAGLAERLRQVGLDVSKLT